MKGVELLFRYNPIKSKNICIKKCMHICKIKASQFDSYALAEIVAFSNCLLSRYPKTILPVVFDFGNRKIKVADKLVYITFECICLYLIQKGYNVRITANFDFNIRTKGIYSSPLCQLFFNKRTLNNSAVIQSFIQKFNGEIYKNHFRKIIPQKQKEKGDFLSVLYTEISYFLKNCNIIDHEDQVAEVITELAGNASEHSCSDCLIDIDISDGYYRIVDEHQQFVYGINIVILDFSSKLLSNDIKEKITQHSLSSERYNQLIFAYNYHKQFFDGDYIEDDFFNICAFQNKISGRLNEEYSGGTGLPALIRSLQEDSDSDNCYVISGKRTISFEKEYLLYKNDWIGFNKENDFFNNLPSADVLNICKIFFPGTAYNLNFVMRCNNDEQ